MAYSSQHNTFVNPADLYAYGSFGNIDSTVKLEPDMFEGTLGSTLDAAYSNDFGNNHQDSAVDLRGYYSAEPAFPRLKTEDSTDFDTFLTTPYSTPVSNPSNTPSPHGDMIFSNANSPGEYTRDQSQTSSPEANTDMSNKDVWGYRSTTDDVILIPQSVEPPKVSVFVDKTKTRAETQIKTLVILDPLSRQYQWIRFPRHTLSKSKQLASEDEVEVNEAGDASIRLGLTLVCATAVEKQDGLDRALRRARGEEPTPRRPRGLQVSDVDKDDDAHPQNGGAVIICEGCKERERKRYDRKKKRNQEEENEWTHYEDDRIIMINEKEFKRWQDFDTAHGQEHSSEAKRVEFAMRITCYCRHQEEKSPMGYKVIFTFRDTHDRVMAQKVSETIQITDDHKNRELPVVETLTTDLQTSVRPETVPAQYAVPMYTYPASSYGMYSQPTTPVVPQFQGFPDQFSGTTGGLPQANPQAFTFSAGPVAAAQPGPGASYAAHQRYPSYSNTPLVSPTEQFSPQAGYPLHRPHSLDSFSAAFACMYSQPTQSQYNHNFASQPPSRNVSRPASPSWEQGARPKKMRAVPGFFMVEDPDNE